MKWRLLQARVLRLVGAVEMLAFGAVFLPSAWMEAIHAELGLRCYHFVTQAAWRNNYNPEESRHASHELNE